MATCRRLRCLGGSPASTCRLALAAGILQRSTCATDDNFASRACNLTPRSSSAARRTLACQSQTDCFKASIDTSNKCNTNGTMSCPAAILLSTQSHPFLKSCLKKAYPLRALLALGSPTGLESVQHKLIEPLHIKTANHCHSLTNSGSQTTSSPVLVSGWPC